MPTKERYQRHKDYYVNNSHESYKRRRLEDPEKLKLYERARERYKNNPSLWKKYQATYLSNPENLKKAKAREQVHKALRKKEISKKPCSQIAFNCSGKIEAHHHNYDIPLEVIWLCKNHHENLHHPINPKPHGTSADDK